MSENEGVVAAYLLDRKGKGRKIGWEEINSWNKEQGLLWVHLNYQKPAAVDWLSHHADLDPVVIHALLSDDPRPRSQVVGKGTLLMLRGVNLNQGSDPEDMVSIRLWITDNMIISSRRRKLLSVSDLCDEIENDNAPDSAGDFVARLTRRLVERMSEVIVDIDDRLDELEDKVVSEKNYQLRSNIARLRREAISLRRYLSPQRDAMSKLCNERVSWLDEFDRVLLRETTDDIIRYIEDLDAVREKAIVIQEELMGAISEQMDRRMYVLSIVAALFLPLGFLTGLLGVNVAGIPGSENKSAFILFCVFLIGVFGAQIYLFKKMKWM